MGVPSDIDARRFYRVALQRLDDGDLILVRLGRPAPAIYLTGYAVECILKALLIVSTPHAGRNEVLRSFRGKLAHDLLWLRDRLKERGVNPPPGVAKEWAYAAGWSTDLRYEPGPGDEEDAARMLDAARVVVGWAKGRM